MKRLAAAWALALCASCGRHDTPVASYFPAQSVGGAGGAESGEAGTAGLVGVAGDAGGAVGEPELVCPDSYALTVPGSRSRYRHAMTGLKWAEAERDCELDGQHLIVIDDGYENDWLAALANLAVTDQPSTDRLMWLGAGDSSIEGEFVWVTGQALPSSFWSPTEPNDGYDGEDCAEMRHSAEWNDDRCNANLTYVCECDGQVSAGTWCETNMSATCGDCQTSCADGQTCVKQQCVAE